MKTLYKAECISLTQKGRNEMADFSLEYYILESEVNMPDDKISAKVYGIEIVKVQKDGQGQVKRESAKISDIFCKEEKIKDLAEMLHKNAVTPITFYDVIDDIIQYHNEDEVHEIGKMVMSA